MNNFKYITKAVKVLLIAVLALLSFNGIGQENPWTTSPKGENPWISHQHQEKAPSGNDKKVSMKEPNPSKTVQTAESRSSGSIRVFLLNDSIIELNNQSHDYYRTLRKIGNKSYTANGAFAAGIVSSSIFNLFAIPLNIITSAIPTKKANYTIIQFRKNNPHATQKEINVVKFGISGKRFSRAFGGMAIGCVINLATIILILL